MSGGRYMKFRVAKKPHFVCVWFLLLLLVGLSFSLIMHLSSDPTLALDHNALQLSAYCSISSSPAAIFPCDVCVCEPFRREQLLFLMLHTLIQHYSYSNLYTNSVTVTSVRLL